jgi:hypothetical protein
MKIKVCAVAVVGFVLASLLLAAQQFDWNRAEREIRRLPPSSFKELPAKVVKELKVRGCTIPQTYTSRKPHNVIQGEFARKGQKDWAVLCSKESKLAILVFWAKRTKCPAEMPWFEDKHGLQGIGGEEIGYLIAIAPVDADYILEHYERYGGPKPPPLDHQGIERVFGEKGSSVLYCHEGEWLRLTGAD